MIVKYISLMMIMFSCSYIGILISRKYIKREAELIEFKKALNILETKIQFTYEPLVEIFLDISNKIENNIGKIFYNASIYLKKYSAEIAWNKSIDESITNLSKEDKNVLKGMGKLLGKTDIQGQLKQIQLVKTFLDNQLLQASEEKKKNEKLYRTLGITFGIMIVIIIC